MVYRVEMGGQPSHSLLTIGLLVVAARGELRHLGLLLEAKDQAEITTTLAGLPPRSHLVVVQHLVVAGRLGQVETAATELLAQRTAELERLTAPAGVLAGELADQLLLQPGKPHLAVVGRVQ
jgi:hypothetical protein